MTLLADVPTRQEGASDVRFGCASSMVTGLVDGSTAVVEASRALGRDRCAVRYQSAELASGCGDSGPGGHDTASRPSEAETAEVKALLVMVVLNGLGSAPPGNWRERALCAESDPELFYPEARQTATEAKSICGVCEVRAECLAAALAAREPHGIWGGLSYRERLAVARAQRPAGHPVRRRRRG